MKNISDPKFSYTFQTKFSIKPQAQSASLWASPLDSLSIGIGTGPLVEQTEAQSARLWASPLKSIGWVLNQNPNPPLIRVGSLYFWKKIIFIDLFLFTKYIV